MILLLKKITFIFRNLNLLKGLSVENDVFATWRDSRAIYLPFYGKSWPPSGFTAYGFHPTFRDLPSSYHIII